MLFLKWNVNEILVKCADENKSVMCIFQVWFMNEMLSKIQLRKRRPYEHVSCITYEWDMRFKWDLKFVYALCISYEWSAKKSMIIKRDHLMCTSCE